MKKILNISFAICLLGAVNSLFYSIDQSDVIAKSEVFKTPGDSLNSEQNGSIIPRSYHFLSFAEINDNGSSEIDPQKSFSINYSINQSKHPLPLQYLIRAQRFLVSQSVRNLIYPFHSFL